MAKQTIFGRVSQLAKASINAMLNGADYGSLGGAPAAPAIPAPAPSDDTTIPAS
jgi:hypothetical protein